MMASAKIYLVLLGIALCNSAFATFSASECDSTKSCLRLPEDCDPTDASCLFFSWKWDGTSFDMELSGGTGGGSQYSAVAFGQVDDMQDADLYFCTGTLQSGVIRESKEAPTLLDIATETGITVTSQATNSGVAECAFTRTASITKTISGGSSKDFDLSSGRYYVLLATGPIVSSTGNVNYHTGRVISTSTFDMTSTPSTMAITAGAAGTNTSTGQSTGSVPTSGLTTESTTKTAESSTTTTTTESSATSKSASSTCDLKKGCFQFPTNCQPQSSDCIRFTWKYDKEAKNFNMQISGRKGTGETYAGVAFGLKPVMENADLYYCTGNSLGSGAITDEHAPPVQLNISAESGITNIVSSMENGVAKCSFVRAASINKPITGSQTHDYDLTNADYYILLAGGNMNGESLSYHDGRVISPEAVRLGASCIFPQMKIYGLLLFVAWLMALNF